MATGNQKRVDFKQVAQNSGLRDSEGNQKKQQPNLYDVMGAIAGGMGGGRGGAVAGSSVQASKDRDKDVDGYWENRDTGFDINDLGFVGQRASQNTYYNDPLAGIYDNPMVAQGMAAMQAMPGQVMGAFSSVNNLNAQLASQRRGLQANAYGQQQDINAQLLAQQRQHELDKLKLDYDLQGQNAKYAMLEKLIGSFTGGMGNLLGGMGGGPSGMTGFRGPRGQSAQLGYQP